MKKMIMMVVALFAMTIGIAAQTTVVLPKPTKNCEMTLMQALQQRHSTREFKSDAISDQQLSDLLWAACGLNRKDGRITAPSAMNMQDIKVYVLRSDGAWRYQPLGHELTKVSTENLIEAIAGKQVSVKTAPVVLLLVSDQSQAPRRSVEMGNLDAGYVSQNICLACEALGLATVPRGSMDKETIGKALNLVEGQYIIVNHPVGYAK